MNMLAKLTIPTILTTWPSRPPTRLKALLLSIAVTATSEIAGLLAALIARSLRPQDPLEKRLETPERILIRPLMQRETYSPPTFPLTTYLLQ